jgi:ComF family protein
MRTSTAIDDPNSPRRWQRLGASQCEVCRSWGTRRLCADCLCRFAAPVPRCQRCALRVPAGVAVCGPCLSAAVTFDRSCCVADYAFPWDRLIASFKFHGHAELAPVLADALAGAVMRARADDAAEGGRPAPDLVLPVPLAPRRLAERGYNQAWELTRRVARRLRLRADAGLLLRPVETAHQAELERVQRLANLRGAFMVEPKRRAALAGRHVALVDDVMTTGATAREAARTLLRAGAASVDIWVVARTPD